MLGVNASLVHAQVRALERRIKARISALRLVKARRVAASVWGPVIVLGLIGASLTARSYAVLAFASVAAVAMLVLGDRK